MGYKPPRRAAMTITLFQLFQMFIGLGFNYYVWHLKETSIPGNFFIFFSDLYFSKTLRINLTMKMRSPDCWNASVYKVTPCHAAREKTVMSLSPTIQTATSIRRASTHVPCCTDLLQHCSYGSSTKRTWHRVPERASSTRQSSLCWHLATKEKAEKHSIMTTSLCRRSQTKPGRQSNCSVLVLCTRQYCASKGGG